MALLTQAALAREEFLVEHLNSVSVFGADQLGAEYRHDRIADLYRTLLQRPAHVR